MVEATVQTRSMRGKKNTTGKAAGPEMRPGQRARTSGIYAVVHGEQHRAIERGVMVRGQIFPACKGCREQVRYVLIEPAPHLLEDDDFRDPAERL